MYLFAITAFIFAAAFAFSLLVYFGFRGFQKFSPKLFRKIEARIEPRVKRTLTPDERESLGICRPDDAEKRVWNIVKEELGDLPPPSPSHLSEGEHWVNLGLKLEIPSLFIRWDTDKNQLTKLIKPYGMTFSTHGHFVFNAVLPGSTKATISFGFDSVAREQLKRTGIQFPKHGNVDETFKTNGIYLQQLFGLPQKVDEFGRSRWDFLRVEITHELVYPPYANDPEERNEVLTIRRKVRSEIHTKSPAEVH